MDPRAWGQGLRRLRRRPFARIATVPARRQHPLRRTRRTRLRRELARSRRRLRRRHAHRPADPGGSGRRTARRLFSRFAPRYAARLRVDGRGQGHAGPRRNRGVRRQRRHGAPGALRLRILRQGKLRQVHAVPDRLDPRRGDGRQDHRRPRPRAERRAFARSLRGDDRRLALRARRARPPARSSARSIISARISPGRRRASRRNRRSSDGAVAGTGYRHADPHRRSRPSR